MSEQSGHFYEFGPFRLDTVERLLLREGVVVPLAPKAFETLLVLVEHRGRVLKKDELMKLIWPDTFVEEGNLAQHIFTLRRALGDGQSGQQYIETMPRRGYCFVASVKEEWDRRVDPVVEKQTRESLIIEDEKDTGAPAQSAVRAMTGFKGLNLRMRLGGRALTVSVLLLVLLAVPFYFWISGKSKKVNPGAGVRSLAVLPFKLIGAESGDEYLGLGMADALITRLGSLRPVVVRPTNAVRNYIAPGKDPLVAGRELKVDAVLDGNIQKVGDRIRVTVHLISVRDGAPLWTAKFDEQFTNILAVQDRVSEQLAQAMTLELSGAEKQGLTNRYSGDPEAYQDYLKGRYFWNKRTEDGYKKAIKYFEAATRRDPNYARAYAGLADTYALLGSLGNAVLPRKEAMPLAKASAVKALELDETIAEAHTSLAFVSMQYEWEWSKAEREFKRAIELSPGYATAHHWYAYYLMAVGRTDEAIAEIRRAQDADPLSLVINNDVGEMFLCARRYDEAIEQCQKTLEMDPNFVLSYWLMAWAYEKKGMRAEAKMAVDRAVNAPSGERDITLMSLSQFYAIWGERGAAQQAFEELKQRLARRYIPPDWVAAVYMSRGEKDQAFAWLEKAYEDRSGSLILLRVWLQSDMLRADPRFADLLRRIGLAP